MGNSISLHWSEPRRPEALRQLESEAQAACENDANDMELMAETLEYKKRTA